MTCLPPHAANADTLSPLSASTASSSAANARPQPTIGYAVLAAARSQACSDLAANPNSRIALGKARALTHLLMSMEVDHAQSR